MNCFKVKAVFPHDHFWQKVENKNYKRFFKLLLVALFVCCFLEYVLKFDSFQGVCLLLLFFFL